MDTSLDKKYYGNIKFPEADSCTVVMEANPFVYRKYTLKYSVVIGHHASNLLSNGAGNKCSLYSI